MRSSKWKHVPHSRVRPGNHEPFSMSSGQSFWHWLHLMKQMNFRFTPFWCFNSRKTVYRYHLTCCPYCTTVTIYRFSTRDYISSPISFYLGRRTQQPCVRFHTDYDWIQPWVPGAQHALRNWQKLHSLWLWPSWPNIPGQVLHSYSVVSFIVILKYFLFLEDITFSFTDCWTDWNLFGFWKWYNDSCIELSRSTLAKTIISSPLPS